jgi:hypothetical protein
LLPVFDLKFVTERIICLSFSFYPDDPVSGIKGPLGHIGGMIRNNFIFGNIGAYFDVVYHRTLALMSMLHPEYSLFKL